MLYVFVDWNKRKEWLNESFLLDYTYIEGEEKKSAQTVLSQK